MLAAIELIERDGYAGASVAAIAARTGVANGALYRHFPSKADLFVDVFRSVCAREIEAMRVAADSDAPTAQRLAATVSTFATRALGNPRLAWALVAEPIDPLVDVERLAYRRRYCELLAELIREGIRSGEFSHQDAGLTAAALVGAIAESLVGPISPATGGQIDRLEIVGELIAFCARAVGAR